MCIWQVQAGLTPRLCIDLDGIRLEEHDDKGALQTDLARRGLTSTDLTQQIEYMLRKGFTREDGARQQSRKLVSLNNVLLLLLLLLVVFALFDTYFQVDKFQSWTILLFGHICLWITDLAWWTYSSSLYPVIHYSSNFGENI